MTASEAVKYWPVYSCDICWWYDQLPKKPKRCPICGYPKSFITHQKQLDRR